MPGPDDDSVCAPGSDDVFVDGGGMTSIDFSLDDQPITLDLDSTAVQRVDPLGNTVQLVGQWENFVGSPFGNRVFVRPLAVPRSLVGSGLGDRLIFDALGRNVTFDGTRFRIPGMGDVTVSGFETIQTINAVVRIIDDGDPGYSDDGFHPPGTSKASRMACVSPAPTFPDESVRRPLGILPTWRPAPMPFRPHGRRASARIRPSPSATAGPPGRSPTPSR